MWYLVATGFVLGLAYAAVPGPVNAETIRRGFSGGFRPAILVQVGAMIGDGFWAVLGLSGAAVFSGSDGLSALLGLLGAGFLLTLALGTFRSALAGPAEPTEGVDRRERHLVVGAMFSLANPVGLAFWAGLGGGLIVTLDAPTRADLGLVLGSFMVAVVFWGFALSAGVAFGRRHARPAVFRLVDAATGLVLGWFGVQLLWSTILQSPGWLPSVMGPFL